MPTAILSRGSPRAQPATTELMSAKIAAGSPQGAAGKSPVFCRRQRSRCPPKSPQAILANRLGERLHQALRFLLLRGGAFVEHFLEDVAGAVGITHVHVGAGQ